MKNKVVEKAVKLYALATRGEGGERENAQRMLTALLSKHGLTESDLLATSQTKQIILDYRYKAELHIFSQFLAKLLNTFTTEFYTGERWGGSKYIKCTLPFDTARVVESLWYILQEAYHTTRNATTKRHKEELRKLKLNHAKENENLPRVFVSVNDLYPKDITEEEASEIDEDPRNETPDSFFETYFSVMGDVAKFSTDSHLNTSPHELDYKP